MTKQFNELINKHMKTLDLYVPIVARVHGGSHPEFHDVHKLFNSMKEALEKKSNLNSIFESLRKVTNDYAVPSDTCESYEAVYNMLEELDKAYMA